MHAEHPQFFEHRQEEERIAHERMRLEHVGLPGRELLAEPSEILADETRLLGHCKGLDNDLLPREPRQRGFEYVAVEAGCHQPHTGG